MLHFSPLKAFLILIVCLVAIAFSLPNFLSDSKKSAIPDTMPWMSTSVEKALPCRHLAPPAPCGHAGTAHPPRLLIV